MDYDESRSCIAVTEERVFKTTVKKALKPFKGKPFLYKCKIKAEKSFKKPSEASLRKYCLVGAKTLVVKNYGKDELLLSFQQYSRQLRTLRHKHRKLINCQNEYKIRSTDLKRRLYVEYQTEPIDCVTDVDEHFYNFINGRLLRAPGPHFKTLSLLYNYSLSKKIETGYRNDTILNIDVGHRREQERYDLSVLRCVEQVKIFDKFILEDYQKSIALLEKWDQLKRQVDVKDIERRYLATQIFAITSMLVGLHYMYNTQLKYGRFLYYLSPPTWRGQNREFAQSVEIEAKGFDYSGCNDDDNFSVLFDKMQIECTSNFVNPALYFEDPSDVKSVFEMIEMQQHYHFTHVLRVSQHAKSIKKGITILKDMIAHETALVANTIKAFESQIKYYSERSNHLKGKFLKILNGWFYKTIGTAEVLKFNLHLEFCYEKICNEKPINMDVFGMAKTLEDAYMDYSFKLEGLSGQSVKEAVIACIKEDKLKEKRSKEAAKELRLFDRLEHELTLAYKPLPSQKDKYLLRVKQTPLNNKTLRENKSQPKSVLRKTLVTESEMEYLRLFTDWTESEDPGQYLLGQNHDT